MINITIFSKNRGAQLDTLIRSIKKFFTDWEFIKFNVLYIYDNNEYKKGYDLTIKRHPEFNYVKETSFKNNVISFISIDNEFTAFMVDDLVFKEDFSLECPEMKRFRKDQNIICLSTRLCPRINYCHTMRIPSPAPVFVEPGVWEWQKGIADFRYPMSLDFHIFRTQDLHPLIVGLTYSSPNYFEGSMSVAPINRPYMMCFQESKVFNIPCNRVQSSHPNYHGGITAEFLNQQYLSGKQISLNNIIGFKNISAHQEIELMYEDLK